MFAGLKIDLLDRRVLPGGVPARLTHREFEVLSLLTSRPGRAYTVAMRSCATCGEFFG